VAEPSNRFLETDWITTEPIDPAAPPSAWAGIKDLTRCHMCCEDCTHDFMVDSKSGPRKFYRDTKEDLIVCAYCMDDYLKEEAENA